MARRSAAICGIVAVLYAGWMRSAWAALSVVGGGLLVAFSWWAIAGAVDALILRSGGSRQTEGAKADETGSKPARLPLVKFFTRHVILALAAYGMMVRLRLDPIGLLTGVSSLGIALVVEAFRDLRWRRFQ